MHVLNFLSIIAFSTIFNLKLQYLSIVSDNTPIKKNRIQIYSAVANWLASIILNLEVCEHSHELLTDCVPPECRRTCAHPNPLGCDPQLNAVNILHFIYYTSLLILTDFSNSLFNYKGCEN